MPVTWRWVAWFVCWVVFVYIIFSLGALERLPQKTKITAIAVLLPLFFVISNPLALSQWKEEHAHASKGTLSPRRPLLHRRHYPDSDVKFQIGPGDPAPKGLVLTWTGKLGDPQFDWLGSTITIVRVDGVLKLSTEVRNRNGVIVAKITNNICEVNKSQDASWEHNYSDDALEVKDERGRIVLQISILEDRVQIQGEWWHENGKGVRMMRPYPYDPIKPGPVFILMNPPL